MRVLWLIEDGYGYFESLLLQKYRVILIAVLQGAARRCGEYNAAGQPLASTQKQLVSQLSPTLESKVISVNERGLTSTQWNVYNTDTKRIRGFSPCFQFITYEKHYLFIVVVIVRYVFC